MRRHLGRLIIFPIVGAAAGVVFTMTETPMYEAKMTIEIQGLNDNFLNIKDVSPTATGGPPTEPYIQTQIDILHSESLVQRTILKLGLPDQLPAQERRPRLPWRDWLRLPSPPPPLTSLELATQQALAHLKVRSNRQTRIVEVLFDAPQPDLAASFVNMLVNQFVDQSLEDRWNSSQHTTEWLRRQLEDIRAKIARSGENLQKYALNSGLLFTGEKDSVIEQGLKQLQSELSIAQADRVAKQARYEAAKSIAPDSLPEMFDSAALIDYRSKLAELRRQKAELESLLTPENYKVKRLQAQIAELESSLNGERSIMLNHVNTEYEATFRRERMLSDAYLAQAKMVSEAAAKAVQYDILKRDVDTNRQFYETILQKMKESSVVAALQATNLRIIDPAVPPTRPHSPNLAYNILFGTLSGCLFGFIGVFLRERVDGTIKQSGDLAFLNVPELGFIPRLRLGSAPPQPKLSRPWLALRADSATQLGLRSGRRISPIRSWKFAALQSQPSLAVDCLRATIASILYSDRGTGAHRVLVVSSASAMEGKTTITANLGVVLAMTGRKVLLIDGDLRRPRLHQLFQVEPKSGLQEILAGSEPLKMTPLDEVVVGTELSGLSLLLSREQSNSDSLHSKRLALLMQRFRREFDYILIDSPPALQIPDARILGRVADAAILVVRAGRTTRKHAAAAVERFSSDGIPVLGTVLNGWDLDHSGPDYYNHNYYQR
jgi:polysaccharide biosynthesis transport protein